jgi:hypothetical protein
MLGATTPAARPYTPPTNNAAKKKTLTKWPKMGKSILRRQEDGKLHQGHDRHEKREGVSH